MGDLVGFTLYIVSSDGIGVAAPNSRVTDGAFVSNLRLIEIFFHCNKHNFIKMVCAALYVRMEQVSD
jgi:hypothetical protein